jgi:hypothetical protein
MPGQPSSNAAGQLDVNKDTGQAGVREAIGVLGQETFFHREAELRHLIEVRSFSLELPMVYAR